MNEIVSKFLLASDKFIPEMHLRQLGFTYSAFGPVTKNNERAQEFKESGDSRYIYQIEPDKACFQHDIRLLRFLIIDYWDFKDLTKRTASDKILHDKEFDITKNPKYNGYQRGFASTVYKFFAGGAAMSARSKTLTTRNKSAIKNENMSNKRL